MEVRAAGRIDGTGLGTGEHGSQHRQPDQGRDRVVLSPEAHRLAREESSLPSVGTSHVPAGGVWTRVTVQPSDRNGMTHVSVRYYVDPADSPDGGADEPAVHLEAEVRTTWLAGITEGTAGGSDRMARIAEALASIAAIPGQSTVAIAATSPDPASPAEDAAASATTGAAGLRPAGYPPPADDLLLAAQVRQPAA